MIKRLRYGILAALLVVGWPAVASAHVLKVDGDIGAVLHINPDDNPTTGAPTDYTVSFDDDTGRFSLPKCTCTVSIVERSKVIATRPLTVSHTEVSENRYTFARPDVYIMRFSGTPKRPGTFQSFVLDYEERVTNGRANIQPIPSLLWVGMSMAVGFLLLGAYTTNYTNEQEERTSA